MKRLPTTLLEYLDQWPPLLVLETMPGRRNGRVQRAASRSGLARRTFGRMAARTTWRGVPVERIDAFCLGCGMDIMHRARRAAYLSKTLTYASPLRHLGPWRLKRLNEKVGKITPPSNVR
jgi:hypothetical protein